MVSFFMTKKILDALREAAAFEQGHPGQFKVGTYHVRIKGERAAVTNTQTGATRIMPIEKPPGDPIVS